MSKQIADVDVKFGVKGHGKVKNAFRGIGTSAKSMLKALGPLYIMMLAVQKAGEGLKSSFNIKLQLDGVEKGFKGLTKGLDFTAKSMNNLSGSVKGTMNNMELMKQTNNALLLGVVKSEDEMGRLLKAAQTLGEAVGKDTTFAVESLVTGMGRQSRLMLDNLGLMVDSKVANQKYAEELGKTVRQLTEAERKQAFLNEAMSQAEEKAAQVGETQETTGVKMARLQASMTNLGATAMEPAFNVIIDGLNFVVKHLTKFVDYFVEQRNRFDVFGMLKDTFDEEGIKGLFDKYFVMFRLGMTNLIKLIGINFRALPFLISEVFNKVLPVVWEFIDSFVKNIQIMGEAAFGDLFIIAKEYFIAVTDAWKTVFKLMALGVETGLHPIFQWFERMKLRIKNTFIDMLNEIAGAMDKWIEGLNVGLKALGFDELDKLGRIGKKTMETLKEEQKEETKEFVAGQKEKGKAILTELGNSVVNLADKLKGTNLVSLLMGDGSEIKSWEDIFAEIERMKEEHIAALGLEEIEGGDDDDDPNKAIQEIYTFREARMLLDDEQKKSVKDMNDMNKKNLSNMARHSKAMFQIQKASRLAELMIQTPSVMSKAYESGMNLAAMGFPAPIPTIAANLNKALAFGSQMALIADLKKAETGFEGQVNKPTMFMVGERGQTENVSVTPLNNPNVRGGATGNQPVQILFEGNVMSQEFIDNSIPMIQDAIRRGL